MLEEVLKLHTGKPNELAPAYLHRNSSSALEAVFDITDVVNELVRKSGVDTGFAYIWNQHTTSALVVQEAAHGIERDLMEALDALAPPQREYAHNKLEERPGVQPCERRNASAHVRAARLQQGYTLPVKDGQLVLGRYQRVLYFEFDGPRERELLVRVGETIPTEAYSYR